MMMMMTCDMINNQD